MYGVDHIALFFGVVHVKFYISEVAVQIQHGLIRKKFFEQKKYTETNTCHFDNRQTDKKNPE